LFRTRLSQIESVQVIFEQTLSNSGFCYVSFV
jgi:hypothetical protein